MTNVEDGLCLLKYHKCQRSTSGDTGREPRPLSAGMSVQLSVCVSVVCLCARTRREEREGGREKNREGEHERAGEWKNERGRRRERGE